MDFKALKGYESSPLDQVKEYAVNIPLVNVDGEWNILFEVRALKNISQAGEICLPGGKVEENETNYEACVRETVEELGIESSKIEFIAELDYTIHPMYRIIRSFMTEIKINSMDELNINPDEVYETFLVPVEFFRKNKSEDYRSYIMTVVDDNFPFSLIPGGKSYPWYKTTQDVNFYRYGDKVIWGLTAKIIKRTMEILEDRKVFGRG